jgi:two-component system C4-dicarboxylate transport response regulator DctD
MLPEHGHWQGDEAQNGRDSFAMRLSDSDIQSDVEHASRSAANVLITGGDSRTRRSVAEQIHHGSHRRDLPLTVVTAEEEQWDAARQRPPATLFIEEVGRLSAGQQEELLQMLDQSSTPREARWRIIAGSGDRLYEKVTQGQFHAALYYRLNVIYIAMP